MTDMSHEADDRGPALAGESPSAGLPAARRRPVPAHGPAGAGTLWQGLWPVAVVGLSVIGVFFGGLGVWAASAPLASAAIAPGVVSPDTRRKTIQHLEGGIIREIRVQEGDTVAAGDVLLVLDDIRASTQVQVLTSERATLLGMRARLQAEQTGADAPRFPPDLVVGARQDPRIAEVLETQNAVFEAQRDALQRRREILGRRIAQLREEIGGLRAQIESQSEQLRLIDEEIADTWDLVDRGLARKPRLLALQREAADIAGLRAQNEAQVARAEQAIGETELQILNLDAERLNEVTDQLSRVRPQLLEVEEQLRLNEDILQRTEIRSPNTGQVLNLRFHTAGGVVGPGEPIMDIVPDEDDLLIDARVSPMDIDNVHVGQRADVHLTAFSARNLPRISGEVRAVTADRLVDEISGEPYFLARVHVDPAQLAELERVDDQDLELTPGMPAEVMILTGERTALDYLFEPLTRVIRRGFRES